MRLQWLRKTLRHNCTGHKQKTIKYDLYEHSLVKWSEVTSIVLVICLGQSWTLTYFSSFGIDKMDTDVKYLILSSILTTGSDKVLICHILLTNPQWGFKLLRIFIHLINSIISALTQNQAFFRPYYVFYLFNYPSYSIPLPVLLTVFFFHSTCSNLLPFYLFYSPLCSILPLYSLFFIFYSNIQSPFNLHSISFYLHSISFYLILSPFYLTISILSHSIWLSP